MTGGRSGSGNVQGRTLSAERVNFTGVGGLVPVALVAKDGPKT